jgi:hypothetical protein
MSIRSFQFRDSTQGWSLTRTHFSNFNLLVGKSGVGKTLILKAIRRVQEAGVREEGTANGCAWRAEIEADGEVYTWSAETSMATRAWRAHIAGARRRSEDDGPAGAPTFTSEEITLSDGRAIVRRKPDSFEFNGQPLPRLKDSESAISLLSAEEAIAPLHRALTRMTFSIDPATSFVSGVPDPSRLEAIRQLCPTIEDLRETGDGIMNMRAYLMQEALPGDFAELKDQYRAIFPNVLDVRFGKWREFDPTAPEDDRFYDMLTVAIKEAGVQDWIIALRMSSGMRRILYHLLDLYLAPRGTVILIDEIEDGLGVNCLPEMTDMLLGRSRDLQFIVTSHHPYIINNVPPDLWRVVTRRGSVVTVLDQSAIPALQTSSAQDRFIQLINLPEYEEAIA